jgi:TorA maturation chaperone TorD
LVANVAGAAPAFGQPQFAFARPDRELARRRSDWYGLLARLLLEPPSRSRLFELTRLMLSEEHREQGAAPEAAALQGAIAAALASPAGWNDLHLQFKRLPRGGVTSEASLHEPMECGCREAGCPRADYVANELSMMSVLCFGEMGAWDEAKGAEARDLADRELRLLDEQVLRCLPRLGDGLAALAGHTFYVAFARYAVLACAQDRRHLLTVMAAG